MGIVIKKINLAHHVDNLLEREAECEDERVGLIVDGALQLVVLLHQGVEQPPLRLAAVHRVEAQGDHEEAEKHRGLGHLHPAQASSEAHGGRHLKRRITS